ncbi:MAG TPA: type II secretion system protein GspK [Rhodanobacteraceae bacterium]
MSARHERGVALILVLWACALMAIVLGGFVALTRSEGLQTRYQVAQARARYAAEAGLARAVAGLQDPDPARRWRVDGQPYTFTFAGAKVTVKVTAEDGKIDLNTATPQVLARFLHGEGLSTDKAHDLAAAIADWRDSDNTVRPGGAEKAAYAQAGRAYGPRNGPFASIEEVQQVLGMTPSLYARIVPSLTIWSGRNIPNAAHAPAAVLAALPGMTSDDASQYVKERRHERSAQGLPGLPNGMPVTAGRMTGTHSVVSTATLANGTMAVLHATIRRRGGMPDGAPYAVLQWREGVAVE